MNKKLLTIIIAAMGLTATAQTKLTSTERSRISAQKTYSFVSVHDPSIVYDEVQKKYIVIGSHLGLGESTDMVTWTGVNTGTEHASLLGSSYRTAFNSCPSHEVAVKRGTTTTTATLPSCNAGDYCSIYAANRDNWISGDMWAPDIVYNPNMKKWCMYLSLNGDNWASVIVLLTSSNAKGPYKYEGPVVFGGFNGVTYNGKSVDVANTDMSIVTGSTTLPARFSSAGTKWGTYYPNCIDPCTFFDADGELWMTYGSWSGGIWMLKLDKNTGLRDYTTTYSGTTLNASATSDQYFGKKIAGGYYVSGEGPYIQKIGNYYYLFMSYGYMVAGYDNYGTSSQKTTGGYEMRVFRSDKPDGPYKDATGNSAIYTSYQLNYGKTSVTNRGMRLLGAMKDWAGFAATGETAQGHNSAIVDTEGNAFVVYHTKFDNSKNNNYGHQIRVQQLYQNEKGWLCASPYRYNGVVTTQNDIETKRLFTADEVAGTFSYIKHPYKLDWANWDWATPSEVTLTADGKITGAISGTWEFTQEGKSYVKITIAGIAYYGVMTEQKDYRYTDMPTMCITAVSNGGVPVWFCSHIGKAALVDSYNTLYTYCQGPIAGDAPLCNHVNATYTVKNKATGVLEPETLSEEGKYTPTTDGHEITVALRASAGNYYYTVGGISGIKTVPATGVCDVTEDASSCEKIRCCNTAGQQVGKNYKGVVIANGKKYIR